MAKDYCYAYITIIHWYRENDMSYLDLKKRFNFQQVGKKVIHTERKGLEHLEQYINEDFSKACEAILSCSGKIIIMGMGKSGHIGRKIAATFASTGTPSFFVHPGEASHGDLGMVTAHDMVLAISNSGESREIQTILPILRRQKIKLICMTNKPESSIGKATDIHLCVKVPHEACPLGLAPTASTTAILAMGDALAIAILQARGFTAENFALSHPGGMLGRKLLLHVKDIMHTGYEIPTVRMEASLRDALLEITKKKLGLTVICDAWMNIEGIFTDGDIRRIFNANIDLNNAKIADVMTCGGIRIKPNILAVDALNLMQDNHITSLMVSESEKLIGVVHMHDILRAGIV